MIIEINDDDQLLKVSNISSGDSGGPLSVLDPVAGQYELLGITSFGLADCGSHPGVYTRYWHEDYH